MPLLNSAYGVAQFLSPPLAAQTISAQTWTVGCAWSHLAVSNYYPFFSLVLVNGSTGAARTTLFSLVFISVRTPSGEETAWSSSAAAGSSAVVTPGDYLSYELGVEEVVSTNAVTLYTDGTTPITADQVATADAQSFVSCAQSLLFIAPTFQLTDLTNSQPPHFRIPDRVVRYG